MERRCCSRMRACQSVLCSAFSTIAALEEISFLFQLGALPRGIMGMGSLGELVYGSEGEMCGHGKEEKGGKPLVEIILPFCEVDYGAEVIPCQHASQTRAHQRRIRRSDVLIRLLMNIQQLLPLLALQSRMGTLVDSIQENRELKAFR